MVQYKLVTSYSSDVMIERSGVVGSIKAHGRMSVA